MGVALCPQREETGKRNRLEGGVSAGGGGALEFSLGLWAASWQRR